MWKKGGDGGGSRWRFNWLMTCPTVKSSTRGNCLIHLFLSVSVAYTMFLYCRTGYITCSCIVDTPLGFSHLMIFLLQWSKKEHNLKNGHAVFFHTVTFPCKSMGTQAFKLQKAWQVAGVLLWGNLLSKTHSDGYPRMPSKAAVKSVIGECVPWLVTCPVTFTHSFH